MLTRRTTKQDCKGPEYWLIQDRDPPGTIIKEASSEIGLGVFTTKFFSKGECDSEKVSKEGSDDFEREDGYDVKESEMVGPSDLEEGYSCHVEELSVASAKGGGFLLQLVPYSSPFDSDASGSDKSYVIPVMKDTRVNQMVYSASGSDQDEVSFSGCDDENYIPSFSSGSHSTDDYIEEEEPAPKVLPSSGVKVCRTSNQRGRGGDENSYKKNGQIDDILHILHVSDHNEGVESLPTHKVTTEVCDKANEIPSCMSGFDIGDYMRKEVGVSEATVSLPSKANVCRTNNESSVLDKKHNKKGRTADQVPSCSSDSDQGEEGIQRQRKSRLSKRLVKGVNNLPSSSGESDTDECKEDEEVPSKASVPSLSGVKVCIANKEDRRVWDKKHYCIYCMKAFPKLPRDLEQVHASEKDVAEALSYSKKCKHYVMSPLLRSPAAERCRA